MDIKADKEKRDKLLIKQLDLSSKRLRSFRESSGFQQKEFAQLFDIEPSIYNRYETGKIKSIPQNILMEICNKFDLNLKWLAGVEDAEKHVVVQDASPGTKRITILGTIAAGLPIYAQEDVLGFEYVDSNLHVDFCLRVQGDSMIGARILDGDLVYIRQQSDVETGEIAAVLVDNDSATLKRIYKVNGTVVLRSENPNFPDQIYTKKDMKDVRILGKAILFKTEVR
ncbi:MAG TPA: XRE family transcriptional regulator [Desulfosporosinus sp.]|nr:XRE family transcriptional regulator [Desulfosporosinus sp.]